MLEELANLYEEMYKHTKSECTNCRAPRSCCSPEYCVGALLSALEDYGVDLSPKIINPNTPLNQATCQDIFLSTEGCLIHPMYRPLCTLHTCDINSFGFKPNDEEWTLRYFELRSQIDSKYLEVMSQTKFNSGEAHEQDE